jgi:hypothetical protein
MYRNYARTTGAPRTDRDCALWVVERYAAVVVLAGWYAVRFKQVTVPSLFRLQWVWSRTIADRSTIWGVMGRILARGPHWSAVAAIVG